MKAKVGERGQVTIPKALRKKLGIRPGASLDFSEREGRLVAVKSDIEDPVGKAFGVLGRPVDSDAFVKKLRGA